MYNFNSRLTKLKRIFAFVMDIVFSAIITYILLIITIAILGFSGVFSSNYDSVNYIFGIYRILPFLIMFRDLIFGGRSLGKRILKLKIVNYTTKEKPKLTKTAFRGFLAVLIFPLELIYLLIEGRTLGDRIANTVVVNNSPNYSIVLHSENTN